VKICRPERMMKISRNRLKKCCTPTQIGNAAVCGPADDATVPGWTAMNRCTDPVLRSPLAAATAAISSTNPIGSSHNRLNHRERPTRTRGAMP
jgi:hypothetical protein